MTRAAVSAAMARAPVASLALALALGALAPAAAQPLAPDAPEVWLVARSVRPSVVRYLRAQLDELGVIVRTTRRERDARGPLVVQLGRRVAHIAARDGDRLVEIRSVALPHGLDTAGRARLAHALRTVIRARQPN